MLKLLLFLFLSPGEPRTHAAEPLVCSKDELAGVFQAVHSQATSRRDPLAGMKIDLQKSTEAEIHEALRLRAKYVGNLPESLLDPERYDKITSLSRELSKVEDEIKELVEKKAGFFSRNGAKKDELAAKALQMAEQLFREMGYEVQVKNASALLSNLANKTGPKVLHITGVPAHDSFLKKIWEMDQAGKSLPGSPEKRRLNFIYAPGLSLGAGFFAEKQSAIVHSGMRPSMGRMNDALMLHELTHNEHYRLRVMRAALGRDEAEKILTYGGSPAVPRAMAGKLTKRDAELYLSKFEFPDPSLHDGEKVLYGRTASIDELMTYERNSWQIESKLRDIEFITRHLGPDALPPALLPLPKPKKLIERRTIYREISARFNKVLSHAEKELANPGSQKIKVVFVDAQDGVWARVSLKGTFPRSSSGVLAPFDAIFDIPVYASKGKNDPENIALLGSMIKRSRKMTEHHMASLAHVPDRPIPPRRPARPLKEEADALQEELYGARRAFERPANRTEIRELPGTKKWEQEQAWLARNEEIAKAYASSNAIHPHEELRELANRNGLFLRESQWLAIKRARLQAPVEAFASERSNEAFIRNGRILAEAGFSQEQIHLCRALALCATIPANFAERIGQASPATIARARFKDVGGSNRLNLGPAHLWHQKAEDPVKHQSQLLASARAAEASDLRRAALAGPLSPVDRLRMLREEEETLNWQTARARSALLIEPGPAQEDRLWQLEREHASVTALLAAELRAQREDSAAGAWKAALQGTAQPGEELRPYVARFYPGSTLEAALADPAKEKMLKNAWKRDLLDEEERLGEANRQLALALDAHVPGQRTTAENEIKAQQLADAMARPEFREAKSGEERSTAVKAALKGKWQEGEIDTCLRVGICAATLPPRTQEAATRDLSALGREILAQDESARAGRPYEPVAPNRAQASEHKAPASYEQALKELEEKEAKLREEIRVKADMAEKATEDPALQMALKDAREAAELLKKRRENLETNAAALRKIPARTPQEEALANRAAGAVLQFLRDPANYPVLRQIDSRLESYLRMGLARRSGSLKLYEKFQEMTRTLSLEKRAQLLRAVEEHAAAKPGIFAQALRRSSAADSAKLEQALRKGDEVALATGGGELAGKAVREELGSAREALATALGVAAGEESRAAKAAGLRQARQEVQNEASTVAARAPANAKGPKNLLEKAEQELSTLAGVEPDQISEFRQAMQNAMAAGESAERTGEHLSHLRSLAGNSNQFEIYRVAYQHAVTALAKEKNWDKAWEEGVRRTLLDADVPESKVDGPVGKQLVNGKEQDLLYFQNLAKCLRI